MPVWLGCQNGKGDPLHFGGNCEKFSNIAKGGPFAFRSEKQKGGPYAKSQISGKHKGERPLRLGDSEENTKGGPYANC